MQLKCKPSTNNPQLPAANDAQNQDDQPNTGLYHIITDHLGTPRELLDDQGNIAWQRRHSTWGNTHLLASPYTKAANDDINCPLVFQGQYADQESGLHYNRFRYYDPDTAQYLSPDPLGLGGGFYSQAYVHNPNGWIDPLGLAGYKETVANNTKILGNAQNTKVKGQDTTHASTSQRIANEMANSDDYSSVHMHQRVSTITDKQLSSGVLPDVAGVRRDNGKVDVVEVLSGRQTAAQMQRKITNALGSKCGSITCVAQD